MLLHLLMLLSLVGIRSGGRGRDQALMDTGWHPRRLLCRQRHAPVGWRRPLDLLPVLLHVPGARLYLGVVSVLLLISNNNSNKPAVHLLRMLFQIRTHLKMDRTRTRVRDKGNNNYYNNKDRGKDKDNSNSKTRDRDRGKEDLCNLRHYLL